MEEPGHAVAAGRYAGEAKSGNGDPIVLAGLAQTEALLAVAAAIDRLAAALSGPSTAAPSPVHPQTYQVEEIRRRYPTPTGHGPPRRALTCWHGESHHSQALSG